MLLLLLLNEDVAVQTVMRLHWTDVCHMDITPANIMMQTNPQYLYDRTRLIDFGFAKIFVTGKQAFAHVHTLLK